MLLNTISELLVDWTKCVPGVFVLAIGQDLKPELGGEVRHVGSVVSWKGLAECQLMACAFFVCLDEVRKPETMTRLDMEKS